MVAHADEPKSPAQAARDRRFSEHILSKAEVAELGKASTSAISNDEMSGALSLGTALPAKATFKFAGYTTNLGDWDIEPYAAVATAWYKFTATKTQALTVSVGHSSTGKALGLSLIVSEKGYGPKQQSESVSATITGGGAPLKTTFHAEKGTTYYFQVGMQYPYSSAMAASSAITVNLTAPTSYAIPGWYPFSAHKVLTHLESDMGKSVTLFNEGNSAYSLKSSLEYAPKTDAFLMMSNLGTHTVTASGLVEHVPDLNTSSTAFSKAGIYSATLHFEDKTFGNTISPATYTFISRSESDSSLELGYSLVQYDPAPVQAGATAQYDLKITGPSSGKATGCKALYDGALDYRFYKTDRLTPLAALNKPVDIAANQAVILRYYLSTNKNAPVTGQALLAAACTNSKTLVLDLWDRPYIVTTAGNPNVVSVTKTGNGDKIGIEQEGVTHQDFIIKAPAVASRVEVSFPNPFIVHSDSGSTISYTMFNPSPWSCIVDAKDRCITSGGQTLRFDLAANKSAKVRFFLRGATQLTLDDTRNKSYVLNVTVKQVTSVFDNRERLYTVYNQFFTPVLQ